MKKVFKIIGKVLLGILILIVAFLIVMSIYNQIMLRKNKDLYETPLGQLVEVDGHNMSIYTEGEGRHTIVFMSGWGTSSPILDFKPLFSRLSDEYRIVVIEKFGYGFSDIVDSERDMNTILRQDREALRKAGIDGPFVLCPHSFSGYEATLWAQQYPEEVEAIVGLDICTPNCKDMQKQLSERKLLSFVKRLNRFGKAAGLVRLVNYDQSGTLTKEERAIFNEIACHITMNDTILNESNYENEIALNEELNSKPLPTVPMIMYVSADNKDDKPWVNGMQAMADASSDGRLIQLDCGHYVHDFEYERIAKDMKEFIETI